MADDAPLASILRLFPNGQLDVGALGRMIAAEQPPQPPPGFADPTQSLARTYAAGQNYRAGMNAAGDAVIDAATAGPMAVGRIATGQGGWGDVPDAMMSLAPGLKGAAVLAPLAVKAAEKEAVPAAEAVAQGIRAYHGSPHDFDAFDISKIGTGEGAQAYGHGLYFAENEGTAKSYRDVLSGGTRIPGAPIGRSGYQVSGVDVPQGMSGHKALDTSNDIDLLLGTMHGNPDSNMIPYLHQNIARRIDNWRSEAAAQTARGNPPQGSAHDDMSELADFYEKNLANASPSDVTKKPPGKMYEVAIKADPEHFLDWDKPLSEQSEHIQNVLAPLNLPPDTSGEKAYQSLIKYRPGQGGGMTSAGMRLSDLDKTPEAATVALRRAGIPGIRYLDQGSRGAGNGTRNYVVFNDKIVDILKKYGMAGLIAGGAAHFVLPDKAQAAPASSNVPLASMAGQ